MFRHFHYAARWTGAVLAPAAGLGLPVGNYPVASSAFVVDILPLVAFRNPHAASFLIAVISTAIFASAVRGSASQSMFAILC